MNEFYSLLRPDAAPTPPTRVYARTIDRDEEGRVHVLFDAIDASWFDEVQEQAVEGLGSESWRHLIERAPVFAIEVNGGPNSRPSAGAWLEHNFETVPEWVEIVIEPDAQGPADLYANVLGPSVPVRLRYDGVSSSKQRVLKAATGISSQIRPDPEILAALPIQPIDHIVVLDVGQGAANACVDQNGDIVAYVDLGSGVLADSGTWPPAMMGLCSVNDPVVILTHWHYDHFEAANRYPVMQRLTWVAPRQTLGPGPQSAFASALISAGTLLVWAGSPPLRAGSITLEQCTGPAGNQNRTGIAVWVEGPAGEDPILLPGDAGYGDIPGLTAMGRTLTSLVVAHHGGSAPGIPPADPGIAQTRVAFSFGNGNGYGHPLRRSINALTGAGFTIGHPGAIVDDRRTEDRVAGLGHIGLSWAGSARPRIACGGCGCSVAPTQW